MRRTKTATIAPVFLLQTPIVVLLDDSIAAQYYEAMILSFRCADTAALFAGTRIARFANIEAVAMRKLAMLHRAAALSDLRIPPNNRLEALQRDRAGQHSIRINDQFRVCFRFDAGNAFDVEIVDYH